MSMFEVELNYTKLYKPNNDYRVVHLNFLTALRVEKNLVEKTKHVMGSKEMIEFKYRHLDPAKQKQEIEQIMLQDPYVVYGIAEFKINHYALLDYPLELGILEKPEFIFFRFVHQLLSRTVSEALNAETGEKIQVAKELPAKTAGINGREYLLKSSALLCEKMNAMLEVPCYENWIAVAYLGSEEFKKSLEDTRTNLSHSISLLDEALQAYEDRKAHLDETEKLKFEKDNLACIMKIKTHPSYAENAARKNSAANKPITLSNINLNEQYISVDNFTKTVAEAFLNLTLIMPVNCLKGIADYTDPQNLSRYTEKLNATFLILESTWRLLRQYKKAVAFPKHKDFSDLSLIVRYTGNFRSIEDSTKNAIMDYTPGNRCTDPLMQFSLNAINYYSKTFCDTHAKQRDEFRNIFIDAYVVMVNSKRNHKKMLFRIFQYLFVSQDQSAEAEMLLQVLETEKNMEANSIKKFTLLKTWIQGEMNKLKSSSSISATNMYPHFMYLEARTASQIEESVSLSSTQRRRNSNAKAKSKIKNSSLSVVTSNVKLEMTAQFEKIIWYIDTYVELHQKFFHLMEFAQKLSGSSPVILAKINELFCLSNRSCMIGDKQLQEIFASDKPLETIEKLKKEAGSKMKILVDRSDNSVAIPESVSARAINWMKERFLNSGNVTPLSDRKMDKSATVDKQKVTEGTLLSPPSAARGVLLFNVPVVVASAGSVSTEGETNPQPMTTANTVSG